MSPHNLIVIDVLTITVTDVVNHPYRLGSYRSSLYRVNLVQLTHKLKHLSDSAWLSAPYCENKTHQTIFSVDTFRTQRKAENFCLFQNCHYRRNHFSVFIMKDLV